MKRSPEAFIRATTDDEKTIKRERLLEAARALFVERGYDRTTISAITRKAGESTGTFYLYFGNKLQVYRTLYREALELFRARIADVLAIPRESASAALSAIGGEYFAFYRDERDRYLILSSQHLGQQEFFRDDFLKEELDSRALELLELIEATIKTGIAAGEFIPHDSRKTTMTLWGMMDGILLLNERRNLELSSSDSRELIDHAVDLCVRGLRKA